MTFGKNMRATLVVVLALLLVGCGKAKRSELFESPEVARAEKTYFDGDVVEAKAALWVLIRSDERKVSSGNLDGDDAGRDVFGLALAYTRLAMIAETEGQKDAADALYSFALRYLSEVADSSKDHRMKINRRMAIWTIDSLEHDGLPRWRKDLNRPASLFYPNFQADAAGDVVEKK